MEHLSDEELRVMVKPIIDRYHSTGYGQNPMMNILIESAERWYNLSPLTSDFDIGSLTIEQMRDLLKKDWNKWRKLFTDELINREYVQVVYHEIRYEDGSGDTHIYVVLMPRDVVGSQMEDLVGDEYIDDILLNTDFDDVDKEGEPQDEFSWVKDGIMNDINQRLIDHGATLLGTQDRHSWTVYTFNIDEHTIELAQTFQHRLSCIVDNHTIRGYHDGFNDGDKTIQEVFKQVLPEFFGGDTFWSPSIRIGDIRVM